VCAWYACPYMLPIHVHLSTDTQTCQLQLHNTFTLDGIFVPFVLSKRNNLVWNDFLCGYDLHYQNKSCFEIIWGLIWDVSVFSIKSLWQSCRMHHPTPELFTYSLTRIVNAEHIPALPVFINSTHNLTRVFIASSIASLFYFLQQYNR